MVVYGYVDSQIRLWDITFADLVQVLQEACLAPNTVCWCGYLAFHWRDVCSAVEWLARKHGDIYSLSKLPESGHGAASFGWYFIEIQGRLPSIDCLETLLPVAGMLKCSEPLDKAFAILGLCNWATNPHQWPKEFTVDYTQPYSRVLAFMYRAAMAHDRELLCHLMLAGISRDIFEEDVGLPSWFPRWHSGVERAIACYWWPFTADNGQPIILEDQLAGDQPQVLSLQGFVVDKVTDLLHAMDEDIFNHPVLLRRRIRSCAQYVAQRFQEDETHTLHTIARTVSLGGRVDVGYGQPPPPSSDEEFINAVSSFFRLNDARRDSSPTSQPTSSEKFDFAAYATCMSVNQRLFRTSKEYIGMGPDITQNGDVVAILFGCRVPFVLRPNRSDSENLMDSTFKLVGECYVDGIMFGEAVKEHMQTGLAISTFHLV